MPPDDNNPTLAAVKTSAMHETGAPSNRPARVLRPSHGARLAAPVNTSQFPQVSCDEINGKNDDTDGTMDKDVVEVLAGVILLLDVKVYDGTEGIRLLLTS